MNRIQLFGIEKLPEETLEKDPNPIKETNVFQKTAWADSMPQKNLNMKELSKKSFTFFDKKPFENDPDKDVSQISFSSDEEKQNKIDDLASEKLKKRKLGFNSAWPERDNGIRPLIYSSDEDQPTANNNTPLRPLIYSSDEDQATAKDSAPLTPLFYSSDEDQPQAKPLFKLNKVGPSDVSEAKQIEISRNQRTPFTRKITSPELKITSMSKLGLIERNSKTYTIEPIPNARGSFMQAFKITSELPLLVDDIPNDQVIIKTFHEQTPGKGNQARLEKFMKNSIEQYKTLLKIGNMPVAKIYNIDTAIQDQYYIMQYLPKENPISSWKNQETNFKDLPLDIQNSLCVVKKFMELMQNESIDMDLKPDNFRLDDQGGIYLVDFTEEPFIDPMIANLAQALRLWSKGNQNICDFLKENLTDSFLKNFIV